VQRELGSGGAFLKGRPAGPGVCYIIRVAVICVNGQVRSFEATSRVSLEQSLVYLSAERWRHEGSDRA
jgi:hypothetical protein